MFHWGWQKVDGTLIDSRFVKRRIINQETQLAEQVWEYLVEVPSPTGSPSRLRFMEKTYKVKGFPEKGMTVPLLINKKGTKAAFDLDDPRIGAQAKGRVDKQKLEKQQQEDEARFDEQMKGF